MVFQLIPVLVSLAISVAISVVAYLLTPQPKTPKTEVTDLENPTADAGRPIPVLFGTITVSGVNVLWYGDKTTNSRKV